MKQHILSMEAHSRSFSTGRILAAQAGNEGKPTIMLPALHKGAAHLCKKQLEVAASLFSPGLQPRSHVRGVQHGVMQGPVLQEREAVVLQRPAQTS